MVTKPLSTRFRAYSSADFNDCMVIFDTNCPTFFAPNERMGFEHYLAGLPATYVVYLTGDKIMGSYGTWVDPGNMRGHLSWMMIDASVQRQGLGSVMMERVLQEFSAANAAIINIAASQKSAPFFARFGARELSRKAEGWGPGLDRVDMELRQ